MTSPMTPTKYVGPDGYITFYVTRNRRPTGADYRQPETGRLYPLWCGWQVGKDPVNGTEGELWLLSKIVANVAYWVQMTSGGGNFETLTGDIGPVVVPDADGNIDVLGGNSENDNLLGIQTDGSVTDNTLIVQLTNRMYGTTTTVGLVADNIISFPTAPPLADGTYNLEYKIVAHNTTDGASGASFTMYGNVVVSGGTPVTVGTPIREMNGDPSVFNVSLVDVNILGGAVRLEVTGVSGKTINWVAILNYIFVGE